MDFTNHPLRKQLLTTEAKALNPIVPTETIVSSNKGSNYARIDDLYDQLTDLVNEQYKAWYCGQFNRLGADIVMRLASTARQESHTDKRHHFSKLLKAN